MLFSGKIKEERECDKVMDKFIKLLDENLNYVNHEIVGNTIFIHVVSNRDIVICPYCGKPSAKVHSHYERKFQDMPMQGKKVKIVLHNRKMFCDNPGCNYATFAERFAFLLSNAKKTQRLKEEIINISINVSLITAASLSSLLISHIADVRFLTKIFSRKNSY
jgi:transposase